MTENIKVASSPFLEIENSCDSGEISQPFGDSSLTDPFKLSFPALTVTGICFALLSENMITFS